MNPLWYRWAALVTAGVMLLGLGMILAPGITQQAFGGLLYGDTQRLAAFGTPAGEYLRLLHGVLGAVLVGWGAALMALILGPFRRGDRFGWNALVYSLAAWFVPDTILSVCSGFGPNAILNLVLATLYAIPLAATRPRLVDVRPRS